MEGTRLVSFLLLPPPPCLSAHVLELKGCTPPLKLSGLWWARHHCPLRNDVRAQTAEVVLVMTELPVLAE